MKLLAQLPTPTMATRTLPSSTRWPLTLTASPLWPFVLMRTKSSWRRVGGNYARDRVRLHGYPAAAGSGLEDPQLAPHVPDPLDDGERRQGGHHVDRRLEQVHSVDQLGAREHESDREDHHPHGPGGQPHLALDPQRLGARACVGDHQRAQYHRHAGRGGDRVAGVGEVPGHGREYHSLLDAIERRVEEGAEEGALARHPRVAAVDRKST